MNFVVKLMNFAFKLMKGDRNSAELWAKPLADRSFACVLWFRNQTQAIRHRSSKRLHSGRIELDFRDMGFTGDAEVIDVWTNVSYGKFSNYNINTLTGHRIRQTLAALNLFMCARLQVRFQEENLDFLLKNLHVLLKNLHFYIKSVVNSGCSAWGGACQPAGTKQPDTDGMFW